jgi:enoyl-[acyl-carrier protein] reductase I
MLAGKRLLITGVVTTDSIAHAVAHRSLEMGAQVVLTSFERDMERTRAAASELDSRSPYSSSTCARGRISTGWRTT